MARLKQDLADAPRRIPDLPDRLANAIRTYLGSIDAVEERIERFKTGYAVVRNSVRYLPLAVANVTRQAQEANDGPLAQSVSTLAQGMNVYLAAPSQPGRERLDTEVERLREASVGYPPTLAYALANMLAHAEVLLARQADTDALFQQATSNDVAALSGRLIDNVEFELSRRRALAARYESGVLAAIGVLAALWIGLAVHQRARGRSVAETAPRSVVAAAPPGPAVGTGHVPQRSIVRHNEPRGVDVEPVAAVPAPSIGFGAESAMLHRFLSERVGDNIASTADRIAARMDYLRQTQQKIRRVLQASEALPELPDGADLDDEIEASVTIAAHVRREINGIADLAKRLASYPSLPNGDTGRAMVDVNACIGRSGGCNAGGRSRGGHETSGRCAADLRLQDRNPSAPRTDPGELGARREACRRKEGQHQDRYRAAQTTRSRSPSSTTETASPPTGARRSSHRSTPRATAGWGLA